MERKTVSKGQVKLDGTVRHCSVSSSENGGFIAVLVASVETKDAAGKESRTDYPVTVHGRDEERPFYEKLMKLSFSGDRKALCGVSVTGIPMVTGGNGEFVIVANKIEQRVGKTEKAEITLSGPLERVSRRDRMATVTIGMDGGSLKVDFIRGLQPQAWDALSDGAIQVGHTVSVTGTLHNLVFSSDSDKACRFAIVGRKFEDVTLTRRRKAVERREKAKAFEVK